MPKKKLRAKISRQRSSMTALELYMNGEVNENGISLSVVIDSRFPLRYSEK